MRKDAQPKLLAFFQRATADRKRGRPVWQQHISSLSADCLNLFSSTYAPHSIVCCMKVASQQISLASIVVRLFVQQMTSFNEVRIHNPFACHVLVHIINIKPSSTPLSLISPGLDVHAVGGPCPHQPCCCLPLLGWMSPFSYVISCLLSVHSFPCRKSPDVQSAFWYFCLFTLRLILWQCS